MLTLWVKYGMSERKGMKCGLHALSLDTAIESTEAVYPLPDPFHVILPDARPFIAAMDAVRAEMNILNLLVPSRLADSEMGYGMLFVVGILTSVYIRWFIGFQVGRTIF